MRAVAFLSGVVGLALATAAAAGERHFPQTAIADPWTVQPERPTTVSALLIGLNRREAFATRDRSEGLAGYAPGRELASPWAASNRDVWFDGEDYSDRLRLRTAGRIRRADGSPLPPGPLDPAAYEAEEYDVTYIRGWTSYLGRTESGLDVSLTPHVGVGVGSRGGSTEAGATLRVGPDLDDLVPEGREAFGERPRWYLFAAGAGRAVGYNFARNRDGDYARSGVSHDSGNFMGDAQIGIALRRGPVQSSVGLIYREIETEGLRAGHGVDTDVSEGLLAFQLSIKPE